MNIGGHRFGKSVFQNAMAEAILAAGRPVAFAKPTHLEIHKRTGHLTCIETVDYATTGRKFTTIVVDELVRLRP
jgi:hypothetical protein